MNEAIDFLRNACGVDTALVDFDDEFDFEICWEDAIRSVKENYGFSTALVYASICAGFSRIDEVVKMKEIHMTQRGLNGAQSSEQYQLLVALRAEVMENYGYSLGSEL